MVDAIEFRDAMSLLPTAVNVVTTSGVTGWHGFTASAVCSVTDAPPTLLVCMNSASRSHAHFAENKLLCVNVLGAQHVNISNAFASKLCSAERFKHGTWTTLVTGSPILEQAAVSFDCEIESIETMGTHSVFMCRVVAIKKTAQHAGLENSLIYFNRGYHKVDQSTNHPYPSGREESSISVISDTKTHILKQRDVEKIEQHS